MWCDQQFVKFDERLRLDQSRRERIERELNRFKEVCQQDEQLRAGCAGSPFLQGSVPSNTVIRPIDNDEYDVDVIYPLRLDAWKPESRAVGGILDWFKKRLQTALAASSGRTTLRPERLIALSILLHRTFRSAIFARRSWHHPTVDTENRRIRHDSVLGRVMEHYALNLARSSDPKRVSAR